MAKMANPGPRKTSPAAEVTHELRRGGARLRRDDDALRRRIAREAVSPKICGMGASPPAARSRFSRLTCCPAPRRASGRARGSSPVKSERCLAACPTNMSSPLACAHPALLRARRAVWFPAASYTASNTTSTAARLERGLGHGRSRPRRGPSPRTWYSRARRPRPAPPRRSSMVTAVPGHAEAASAAARRAPRSATTSLAASTRRRTPRTALRRAAPAPTTTTVFPSSGDVARRRRRLPRARPSRARWRRSPRRSRCVVPLGVPSSRAQRVHRADLRRDRWSTSASAQLQRAFLVRDRHGEPRRSRRRRTGATSRNAPRSSTSPGRARRVHVRAAQLGGCAAPGSCSARWGRPITPMTFVARALRRDAIQLAELGPAWAAPARTRRPTAGAEGEERWAELGAKQALEADPASPIPSTARGLGAAARAVRVAQELLEPRDVRDVRHHGGDLGRCRHGARGDAGRRARSREAVRARGAFRSCATRG